MNTSKRVIYLDLLRIFAIFGVVVIHVSAIAKSYDIGSFTSNVGIIYNGLVRWSVPVFFMISGAMFLRPDKEYSFSVMIKKYIPRIVICLLVWGLIYALFDVYLYSSFSIKTLVLSVWNTISNNSGYHLWFLFALIALYLMVPVFKIIVNNLSQKQLSFVLFLWMFLSLGVSQYNEIVSALDIPLQIDWYFPMITGWAGYFLLGYYLMKYDIKKKYKTLLIVIGIALLVLCPIMNMAATIHTDKYIDSFIPQSGLSACFEATMFFLIIKGFSKVTLQEKCKKIIINISNNTFGIYLIHVLINSVLFHVIKIQLDFINPIVSILIISLLVFIISYLFVWMLKKIPILKNIVS